MEDKWYYLYDLQVRRHQEDIAAAEHYRLAESTSKTRRARGQKRAFVRRVLYAVGSRLMSWGCRLQSMAG